MPSQVSSLVVLVIIGFMALGCYSQTSTNPPLNFSPQVSQLSSLFASMTPVPSWQPSTSSLPWFPPAVTNGNDNVTTTDNSSSQLSVSTTYNTTSSVSVTSRPTSGGSKPLNLSITTAASKPSRTTVVTAELNRVNTVSPSGGDNRRLELLALLVIPGVILIVIVVLLIVLFHRRRQAEKLRQTKLKIREYELRYNTMGNDDPGSRILSSKKDNCQKTILVR